MGCPLTEKGSLVVGALGARSAKALVTEGVLLAGGFCFSPAPS